MSKSDPPVETVGCEVISDGLTAGFFKILFKSSCSVVCEGEPLFGMLLTAGGALPDKFIGLETGAGPLPGTDGVPIISLRFLNDIVWSN